MVLMEEYMVNSCKPLESDLEDKSDKYKETEAAASRAHESDLDSFFKGATNDDSNMEEWLDQGLMQYGCSHYRRRCRIRAPCCNEIFDCRHCHNEAKNNINVEGKLRHDLPRHQVQLVICSLCGTEQEVGQICTKCGVCMGKYFCGTCKLYDDDISKNQYHCKGCGICRIGGRENFFHCYKCGKSLLVHGYLFLYRTRSANKILICYHIFVFFTIGCCYSVQLKNSHPCVEGAMHHDCPVCFEVKITHLCFPFPLK
ncbi:hypothetical protein AQUCO_02000181v1 [Aquilegia coerulea]|uniref:CHY-type domain-containing protein n=1 Tax=Aquilegia coerulea TaxID=218851 RepID=A0A2G5DGB8_AQUCA|nr:hypothetical protein AQUCO_02000181v1 [Aquilegia coerulea]